MRPEEDDDTAARSDDELRALVEESADARSRVRAAWALASRVGAAAIPALREGRASEPSIGVRQHLLTVLARMRETTLVEVVARDEPDARLRATACSLLAHRLEHDRASVPKIVERLAHERDPIVLRALIQALPSAAPPLIEAGCDALLDRSDPELRIVIYERHIAGGGSLARALHDPLARESAEVRGRILDAWLARSGARAVVRGVHDAPVAIAADALVRASAGALEWADVAALAARNLPALDALLLPHASEPRDSACRSFLVAAITRALDPGSSALFGSSAMRAQLVQQALARLDRALDDRPSDDPVLAILLEAAERMLARLDPEAIDVAEHHLIAKIGRLRHRLGAPGPHGWLGAVLHRRAEGGTRTIVEHTSPDGTSAVVLTATSGLELRAPAHALAMIATSLPDPPIADALALIGPSHRTRFLDPDALDRALSRALPPHPALATDLGQLARITAARGAPLRADFDEGWWDAAQEPSDRPTLLEQERRGPAPDEREPTG